MMMIQSTSPFISVLTKTSILFLWAKGSRQIHAYQISSKEMILLPSFETAELQNAVTFLPKRTVDIRKVEILQGLRFISGKIERFGFTIPRNRVGALKFLIYLD